MLTIAGLLAQVAACGAGSASAARSCPARSSAAGSSRPVLQPLAPGRDCVPRRRSHVLSDVEEALQRHQLLLPIFPLLLFDMFSAY